MFNYKLGRVLSFAEKNYKEAERNTRNEGVRVNGITKKGKLTFCNAYKITYERSRPLAHIKVQRVRKINYFL
jgi:hypothetical protein